jgi:cell division transport system permease protein
MSHSDPLDGKIREALAEVVSQAPDAPDFDDIEPTEVPQSKRRSRPIAWAAAAAVVVVIAGVTLTGTDDTSVDTGMGPEEPQQDGSAVTPCEESASHIAADTDVLVFLQPESTSEQHDQVARLIGTATDAEVVRFLDQRATYDEFRDLFADSPEIVESVTAEILPPRFELSVAGPLPVDAIADTLRAEPAVREVIDADRARADMIAQCEQRRAAADDGAEQATTTTEVDDVPSDGMPPVDDDRWEPYVMGGGGLTGTRTSPGGRSLVVTFVGGAPYLSGKACTVVYRAEVDESAGEVTVQLFSNEPPPPDTENFGCTMKGYFRSVEVGLDAPLGDRTVLEDESRRRLEVFDGSLLAEPTWMPEGWTLLSEQAGFPNPETAAYWQRTWGAEPPPPTGDSCTPSDSPVSLTQGLASGPDRDVSFLQPVSTHDVHGAQATYYEGGPTTSGQVALIWEMAGQSFVLDSGPSCFGEGAASLDRLLEFARSLAVPGS